MSMATGVRKADDGSVGSGFSVIGVRVPWVMNVAFLPAVGCPMVCLEEI